MKSMYDYQIGNTPMVELPLVHGNRILLKLESKNFLGSIKARTGYWLINSLTEEARGKTIIESTSGNLGLALGFFCREENIPFTALVDSSIAKPKLDQMKENCIRYRLVERYKNLDPRSSRIRKARSMMAAGQHYWINQYDNPNGVLAHEKTTGPEIWQQTNGSVTHCVCAMGSCGTICGIGKYLKSVAPNVKICGVEPYGSTIFATTEATYINVGAGMAGQPGNIRHNPGIVDWHDTLNTKESIHYAQQIYHQYDVNSGVSGGMVYGYALKIAQQVSNAVIVGVIADGREAYENYF